MAENIKNTLYNKLRTIKRGLTLRWDHSEMGGGCFKTTKSKYKTGISILNLKKASRLPAFLLGQQMRNHRWQVWDSCHWLIVGASFENLILFHANYQRDNTHFTSSNTQKYVCFVYLITLETSTKDCVVVYKPCRSLLPANS